MSDSHHIPRDAQVEYSIALCVDIDLILCINLRFQRLLTSYLMFKRRFLLLVISKLKRAEHCVHYLVRGHNHFKIYYQFGEAVRMNLKTGAALLNLNLDQELFQRIQGIIMSKFIGLPINSL